MFSFKNIFSHYYYVNTYVLTVFKKSISTLKFENVPLLLYKSILNVSMHSKSLRKQLTSRTKVLYFPRQYDKA